MCETNELDIKYLPNLTSIKCIDTIIFLYIKPKNSVYFFKDVFKLFIFKSKTFYVDISF